ncbi:anamorsin [Bufo bufo]|uniref:anamorsin n=1 Tax=Bufo bufo TaxID=8384 RepID=UPI001ABE06F1|nr:anamorsin [Bufo bufo]
MAALKDRLSRSQSVLVTWDVGCVQDALQGFVSDVQALVAPGGRVSVENVERLISSAHADSRFDAVLLGLVPGSTTVHSAEVLEEVARILKPGGNVLLKEPVDPEADGVALLRSPTQLYSALKLSGLTEVTQVLQGPDGIQQDQGPSSGDVAPVTLAAKKPNYEVGSSQQLSLSRRPVPGKSSADPAAVKLWTLSANDMNDEDVDLLDSDELLDQDDLKKPPPSSLRAGGCGEGSEKKRKACKNCSCGLAEELEEEKSQSAAPKPASSACGSCYLGDAFRCASCPYLGMPAFKPGEKVLLNPGLLGNS